MSCAVKDGTYKNEKGQTTVSLWSKIKYFRQVFGAELGFNTNVMEYEDYYICKATILAYDPERILSSGHYKQFKKKTELTYKVLCLWQRALQYHEL
jgi:hypothetical protein